MHTKHIALAAMLIALSFAPAAQEKAVATSAAANGTRMAPSATLWAQPGADRPRAATNRHSAATSALLQVPMRSTGVQLSSTGDDYTTHSLSVQEVMMMNFINQDRAARGLYPLTPDPELSRIARIKSQDMLDGGYFAHESPTWGSSRDMLRAHGYAFRGAAENIARHATVEKAHAALLSSPGHRANLLSPNWEKVGVGIAADRNGHVWVTQLFAR